MPVPARTGSTARARAAHQHVHPKRNGSPGRGDLASLVQADHLQIGPRTRLPDRLRQALELRQGEADILEADMAHAGREHLLQPLVRVGDCAIVTGQHEHEAGVLGLTLGRCGLDRAGCMPAWATVRAAAWLERASVARVIGAASAGDVVGVVVDDVRTKGSPTVMFTPWSMPRYLTDQALVVVLRHDYVELASARPHEIPSRGPGPRGVHALGPRQANRRADHVEVLAPEQAVLARMWVEARHRDAGPSDTESAAGLVGKADRTQFVV